MSSKPFAPLNFRINSRNLSGMIALFIVHYSCGCSLSENVWGVLLLFRVVKVENAVGLLGHTK